MTTKTAPKAPSPAAKAADTRVKQLPFAFPFLRKGQGKSDASAKFTDEHDVYRLLAEREPSGSYLVSKTGMWHGGIHVTEAGAGQALDLDAGVRCIADGHVIAYRINQTYPVSEVSASGSEATVPAPYSTGFALVRHSMEFPKGTTLTFYSLYMHLQAYEDYANDSKRQKPAYWSTQFQVTEFAKDTPTASKTGQPAETGQEGLRVRQSPPHSSVIALLPQGASVSIGERKKSWGRISDLHGSSLYAPVAGGFVEPSAAVGGWIFLGNENGGPLVREVMPDASFERVMFPSSTASQTGDSSPGVPIKAGELIGHLGRYDSLNQCTAGTRMVHIEVFCDDSIDSFIQQGRAWIEEHSPHPKAWAALGLPAEPTILRIAPKTKLYQDHDKDREGANAPLTDVIQVYSFAELGRDKKRQFTEAQPDARLERKVSWWHVENANALGNPIEGWVREYNHASGRVTREFAQAWIDFQCLADTHDPAHTIFATSKAWADYASGADVPGAAALDKLSPLMGGKVYRALFAKGDGSHAADDLCNAGASDAGHYPWLMQASSRLIVKHESEWANPEKWKQLIAELEKQTGPKPQHAEELKRIDKLTWWDEVKAGVPGFPGPEVFHIHPVGLVGNFKCSCNCINVDAFLQAYEAEHASFETGTQSLDATSKENLQILIQGILDYYGKYENGKCSVPYIAYMLGTARLETKKYHKDVKKFIYFEPTTEGGSTSYFNKYDPVLADTEKRRQRAKDNGNTQQGDGYTYRGRGYVQVTWKNNYQAVGERIGVDLAQEPDRMLEPEIAAWATVYGMEKGLFTGKKLSNYISDTAQDYVNARRIINGLDQAETIADFATRFKSILEISKC